MDYKKFKTPQKVGFIGLIAASGLLSLLFAYDHFIKDIRITVIHIFAIIFLPIAIGNYLMKKEKEKT
jgi:intracellular septation protein A